MIRKPKSKLHLTLCSANVVPVAIPVRIIGQLVFASVLQGLLTRLEQSFSIIVIYSLFDRILGISVFFSPPFFFSLTCGSWNKEGKWLRLGTRGVWLNASSWIGCDGLDLQPNVFKALQNQTGEVFWCQKNIQQVSRQFHLILQTLIIMYMRLVQMARCFQTVSAPTVSVGYCIFGHR